MTTRKCKVCPGWHDLAEPWPQACMGHYAKRDTRTGLQIVKDIEPYRNVIDGGIVGGRRQHREFLRRHDLVEVGTEKPKLSKGPVPYGPGLEKGLRETLQRNAEKYLR